MSRATPRRERSSGTPESSDTGRPSAPWTPRAKLVRVLRILVAAARRLAAIAEATLLALAPRQGVLKGSASAGNDVHRPRITPGMSPDDSRPRCWATRSLPGRAPITPGLSPMTPGLDAGRRDHSLYEEGPAVKSVRDSRPQSAAAPRPPEGRCSASFRITAVRWWARVVGRACHLSLPARGEDSLRDAPQPNSDEGRLCGQGVIGACRSEGFTAGQHVRRRRWRASGDLDAGDLGATLFAAAPLGAFVVRPVAGVLAAWTRLR